MVSFFGKGKDEKKPDLWQVGDLPGKRGKRLAAHGVGTPVPDKKAAKKGTFLGDVPSKEPRTRLGQKASDAYRSRSVSHAPQPTDKVECKKTGCRVWECCGKRKAMHVRACSRYRDNQDIHK